MSLHLNLSLQKGAFTLHSKLDLPVDKLIALSGPSGCGKSTLLRAIAGLEWAECNEITFKNERWQSPSACRPPHQRSVAMVFQKPALFTHLNVKNNLRYAWKRRDQSHPEFPIQEAAKLLGISHLLKRSTYSLSGGEAQRVAIARALVATPSLLLMDEPLSALDEQSKQSILPYLERIHRSLHLSLIYVSHSIEELARLADYIVMMDQGKVIKTGEAQDLLSDPHCGLGRHEHAQSIFEGTTQAYDPHTETCTLQTAMGRLQLSTAPQALDQKVRIRIKACDISIALHQVEQTSILNLLPATIKSITPVHTGQCLIALEAKQTPLLARISSLSVQRLHLNPGMEVIAQVKSAALLGEL
ncbi:molybdenum ABC transporter ATP-binding protein [Kiritimatiellota bacterium B12222]|nr:molybdenum ABC transporter ATP-binding protein [Kiritimatiellota bacterium B12222]